MQPSDTSHGLFSFTNKDHEMTDAEERPTAADVDQGDQDQVDTPSVGGGVPGHAEEAQADTDGAGGDGEEGILQPESPAADVPVVDDTAEPVEAAEVESVDDTAPPAEEAAPTLDVDQATTELEDTHMSAYLSRAMELVRPVRDEEPVAEPLDEGDVSKKYTFEVFTLPGCKPVRVLYDLVDSISLGRLRKTIEAAVITKCKAYNNGPRASADVPQYVDQRPYLKKALETADLVWRQRHATILNTEATQRGEVKPAARMDSGLLAKLLMDRPNIEQTAQQFRRALQTGANLEYSMRYVLGYLDKLCEVDGDPQPVTEFIADKLKL